jgi:hypothetical protein
MLQEAMKRAAIRKQVWVEGIGKVLARAQWVGGARQAGRCREAVRRAALPPDVRSCRGL